MYGEVEVEEMTWMDGTLELVVVSLVEALTSSMTPSVRAIPYEAISCVVRSGGVVPKHNSDTYVPEDRV